MRRRLARAGAGVVAAVVVALLVNGPLHMVLERHVWCAEHGDLVRAHDEHGLEEHGDHHAPARSHGPASPHGHDEDRCAWALLLQAPGAPASVTTPSAAPTALAVAAVLAPRATPAAPIAVLALAPSHSPPSAPVV